MSNSTIKFEDYNIFSAKLGDFPTKRPLLINTINQYSYCVAKNDVAFKKALVESDVLLPDGIAVVMAAKFLTGDKIKKIAGADIHNYLLQDLNQKKGTCFYLGSSEGTLAKIKAKLAIEFPNIKVGTFSPPYKPVFSDEDNRQMIEAVNNAKPDVVFVGMTAPKQEKWATQHKHALTTNMICTIGAVFDFYAGTIDRPSKIWINLGLEWFVRLIKEPKRMWKRYLYYGPVYVYDIIGTKIRGKRK